MTSLGPRPSKQTKSGLSQETDEFLTKLMKKNGMSIRKQAEIKQTIYEEGTLPLPPKPKVYKPPSFKPRPEQKIFTMARIGQRPLVKQESTILEETNFYEVDKAPNVPLGPSSDEKKAFLAMKMYGIDEEEEKRKRRAIMEQMLESQPAFTLKDQILKEIQDRTDFLEKMHELGVHEHDGEILRQIDQRMAEIRKLN